MTTMADDEAIAVAVTEAIRAGDVATLTRLLEEDADLATVRIVQSDCDDDQGTDAGRTLLHIATDWPGNFPNGGSTVRTLAGAGADVNARCRDGLTPLDAARRSEQDGLDPAALVAWLLPRGAKSASELG
jgi:ankyrin repeat protein